MDGGKIYGAISSVMAEIGTIGKNKKNGQQGFMYRGIDDVMNALNPALIKHHVFIAPEILEQNREERQTSKGGVLIYSICKIKFTFYAEDGSNISVIVIGEGMDSGDKATNKAMSVAYKYACFQVFCIPTEEMKDQDAESHEVTPEISKANEAPDADKVRSEAEAAAEQMQKISEYVQAYAELCGKKENEVWTALKKTCKWERTGDLRGEVAQKTLDQVKFWYDKTKAKKEAS